MTLRKIVLRRRLLMDSFTDGPAPALRCASRQLAAVFRSIELVPKKGAVFGCVGALDSTVYARSCLCPLQTTMALVLAQVITNRF